MTSDRWFEAGSCSLIGDRQLNQDRVAIFHQDQLLFLVLADGMGGHPRGDRAAEIAVETCELIQQVCGGTWRIVNER